MLELSGPKRTVVPVLRPRSCCPSGSSEGSPFRGRKLTPVQELAIRASMATTSLRSLAVEFRVSQENIRSVIRNQAGAGEGVKE